MTATRDVTSMGRAETRPFSLTPTVDAPPSPSPDGSAVLQFPGIDGVPYLGPRVDMKRQERAQAQLTFEGHAATLDLSKPDDMSAFQAIIREVGLGRAVITRQLEQYDQETRNWRVLVCWNKLFWAHTTDEPGAPRG